jgi:hypothetical protein
LNLINEGDLRPGDVLVEIGVKCFVVEREVPDVPTRVVGNIGFEDRGEKVVWGIPQEWDGPATVIKGKDELPVRIKQAIRNYYTKGYQYADGEAACDSMVLHDFIRSRWPEAFKEKP